MIFTIIKSIYHIGKKFRNKIINQLKKKKK